MNPDAYLLQLMGQAATILTGASNIELKVQLFDVMREFFLKSNSWLETLTVPVVPDTLDYPVVPSSGYIIRLSGVTDQNNVPQSASMPEVGTIHFFYPYTDPQNMSAVVVKTVVGPLDCFDFPDWLLPIYGDAILDGLLGRMMVQPNQSYTDKDNGVYHLRRFWDAINHARVATMRQNTIGAQAWIYPQQFRVTSQRGGVSTFNVSPTPAYLR